MRILLLEDNEDDVVLIEELIADESKLLFEVVVADRMSTAISHLERSDFDIILLDLSLPDSQGLATLKKMQTQASWLPIIVMTGLDNNTLGDTAVREGAQDYLVKGQFDRGTLLRAIRYALERQRMMTNLRDQSSQLRASEERFRQLVERNLDAVLIVDTAGMIRYVNPAAAALLKPRGDNLLQRPFGFFLQQNGFSEISIEGIGGKPITAELRSVEIDWEGDKAFLTTLHDITQRKDMERESER